MDSIRHVLFDADGVLQTWLPGTLDKLRSLPTSVPPGVTLPAAEDAQPDALVAGFLQAVFRAEAPCLRGEAHFADVLAPVLAAWGVQPPLEQVLQIWQAIDPYPGMFAHIARLRDAGICCHLATNQQRVRAAHMRQVLGYDALFDQSFYSCDMGVAKPDTEYFKYIVSALAVAPEQVLFIDDRHDNVAAAQQIGLHGLQFEARSVHSAEAAFVDAAAPWQLPLG